MSCRNCQLPQPDPQPASFRRLSYSHAHSFGIVSFGRSWQNGNWIPNTYLFRLLLESFQSKANYVHKQCQLNDIEIINVLIIFVIKYGKSITLAYILTSLYKLHSAFSAKMKMHVSSLKVHFSCSLKIFIERELKKVLSFMRVFNALKQN